MAAIANDWLVPMSGEFKKPYYRKLYEMKWYVTVFEVCQKQFS